MAIDGERVVDLGSKITADGDCNHEIKRRLLLRRKVMTNLDSILKSRDFVNKGPSSQGYGFSSSHIWMWQVDYKEIWAQKYWFFWTVVLEKTLESPLDCKEISPWCSLEGLLLKLKLQYFGHLMWRVDSLENTLMLGGIGGRQEKGTTEVEMVGWHHWLNGHEFEQTLGDTEGQGSLACYRHGVARSWTWRSDWKTATVQ